MDDLDKTILRCELDLVL